MSILKAKLDPELVTSFARRFYGYGNYKSRIWFVGVEEGGGDGYEAVNEHLQCWRKRRQRELENLRRFHEAKRRAKWFNEQPQLQRTWKGLLRILLSAQGISPNKDALRTAQAEVLGGARKGYCLLELLPLPAPGMRKWPYKAWIDDPELRSHLKNRKTYKNWAREFRVPHLQEVVQKHRPKVVLFYGRVQFYLKGLPQNSWVPGGLWCAFWRHGRANECGGRKRLRPRGATGAGVGIHPP